MFDLVLLVLHLIWTWLGKPRLEMQTNSRNNTSSNPKISKWTFTISPVKRMLHYKLCKTKIPTAKVSKWKRPNRFGLANAAPFTISFQISSPHLLMTACLSISLKVSNVLVFCNKPWQRIPFPTSVHWSALRTKSKAFIHFLRSTHFLKLVLFERWIVDVETSR